MTISSSTPHGVHYAVLQQRFVFRGHELRVDPNDKFRKTTISRNEYRHFEVLLYA
jgi:hypothetical protein